MEVIPLEEGGLRFRKIPAAFFNQLTLLPDLCGADDDPEVAARLFPPPVDEEEESPLRESLEEDWADYVRPELEAAFDRSLRTVVGDLGRAEKTLPGAGENEARRALEIPPENVPSWFQVLNRARIVLSLRFRLPLSEYPLEPDEDLDLTRLLAAQLSDHYAEILEILVYQMNREID